MSFLSRKKSTEYTPLTTTHTLNGVEYTFTTYEGEKRLKKVKRIFESGRVPSCNGGQGGVNGQPGQPGETISINGKPAGGGGNGGSAWR